MIIALFLPYFISLMNSEVGMNVLAYLSVGLMYIMVILNSF